MNLFGNRLPIAVLLLALALSSISCTRKESFDNPFDPSMALVPPRNLRIASLTDSSIGFKWTAHYAIRGQVQSSNSAILVEGSPDDTLFSVLDSLSAADTSGSISTSVFDTSGTFYFRIFAKIGTRITGYSNVVSWNKSSINPFGLSISEASEVRRKLLWHGKSSLVRQFQIERRTGVSGTFDVIGETSPNITTFIDSTIILADTAYYYRVCAISQGGLRSLYDTASISIPFVPPDSLSYFENDSLSITLNWINNFPVYNGSMIERSEDSVSFQTIGQVAPGVTSYTDNTVDPSKVYFYRIQNFTHYQTSPYSNCLKILYGCFSARLIRNLTFPFGGQMTNGSLLVSRDASTALAWSSSGTIYVWDLNSGSLLHAFSMGEKINRVALSGNGKVLGVTDSVADGFSFFSSADGNLLRTIKVNPPAVDLQISDDGSAAITTDASSAIEVWDLSTGMLVRALYANHRNPISLFLTETGDTLVSGGGKTLCYWNWQTGTLIGQTKGGPFERPVFMSSDGALLGTQIEPWGVNLLDLSVNATLTMVSQFWPNSAFPTSDGRTLIVGYISPYSSPGGVASFGIAAVPPVRTNIIADLRKPYLARVGNGTRFIVMDSSGEGVDSSPQLYSTQYRWISGY